MLQIVLVVPNVTLALRPYELSVTVHLIVQPASPVFTSIRELHDALPTFSIIPEFSNITVSIYPLKLTFAKLFIFQIISLKGCSIRPCFLAFSVPHIVLPLSFIYSSISCYILTVSMSFIVSPVADVNISIRMIKSTLSFSFSVIKFPSVGARVGEVYFSVAIFLSVVPLSEVIAILVDFEGSKHMGVGVEVDFGGFEFLIDHIFLFDEIAG